MHLRALTGLLLCVALSSCGAASRAGRTSFDLEEATIAELQYRMETGRDTARSLAEKYLARIEALDRRGPGLRSVLEINPDALKDADALDAERRARGRRGLLHGIPILVKDNIETAGPTTTTAGSLALEGHVAGKDAFVIARLRAAGAVILGKTNMSEWAGFRAATFVSGWSGRGGQTRNPYALDRNPSGSSSGSAVAVAANLSAAAIGTETDGSIVSPASANGIVGIKPTFGLLSRSGVIPLARSFDTPGPFARSVQDAAALLTAMAGIDADDALIKRDVQAPIDYSASLDAEALKGARIGVLRIEALGYRPPADRVLDAAVEVLHQRGATIVPVEMVVPGQLFDDVTDVMLYEFKADVDGYLGRLGSQARVHSLADLIAFNTREAAREMPIFGQDLLLRAERRGRGDDAAYRGALARAQRTARGILAQALESAHLDALVSLTGPPAWLTDSVNGDSASAGISTLPAVAGYPHVTVPAGSVAGLPMGVSFIGRPWTEPELIRLAYAFEQASKRRVPPRYPATITATPAQGKQ